jgi:RNA polymerase sigma-70 factor (ECF subfamily)
MTTVPQLAVHAMTLDDADVPALVAAARKRPAAFAALYDRFLPPVYRYLYHRTGSPADAEDLCAQTFLAALEALPRYREQGYFAAWLFAIARRKLMSHFRGGRTHTPLEWAEHVGEESDLLGRAAHRDELARLGALIGTLTEDEQELIRLRYTAGLSFGEMAVVVGKQEAAVKKSLYRLLARLQHQLEPAHD